MKHVQSFIDRFRFNASKSSLVQSRIKYMEKMDKVQKVVDDDPNYRFDFT